MEDTPIYRLPQDTLYQIFSAVPLRQIMICRTVCKLFNQFLTSSSFLQLISTRSPPTLLALRPPHHRSRHASPHPALHAYDPDNNQWLRFNLDFLPFRCPHPVASSLGLVYLWADPPDSSDSNKSLIVCNPLTRHFKVLPQLGSAWSRHGLVLVDSVSRVLVLTELTTLYFSLTQKNSNQWLKIPSNLPSKPRSPVLVANYLLALCDVGTPWKSQWKLFSCELNPSATHSFWECLERREWGDIFDIMKRPRLLRGSGNEILMIGGLKLSYLMNPACLTILILRLDLKTLEWEEAGRMPEEMYRSFSETSKVKVFGGGDRVCFSGKRARRMALWDRGDWRWIEATPGCEEGVFRGFEFEPRLTALP